MKEHACFQRFTILQQLCAYSSTTPEALMRTAEGLVGWCGKTQPESMSADAVSSGKQMSYTRERHTGARYHRD
jgi:hypothetical protein